MKMQMNCIVSEVKVFDLCILITTGLYHITIMDYCDQYAYVTGFGKTCHVCTKTEIHLIASHTQALSRHSDNIGIDNQVLFYRWLFANPVKL